MKIISLNDVESYSRNDGRTVHVLLREHLDIPPEGITLFLSKGPHGHINHHYHSRTPEIIIFPKGGKLIINDEEYHFNEWDGVLLEPGDRHGYTDESLGDTLHFAILLSDRDDRKST